MQNWASGSWKTIPTRRASAPGPARPRLGDADPSRAGDVACDRVWNGAVQAEREGALAAAARAEHEHTFARFDRERDIVQRWALSPDVLERECIDLDHDGLD